MESKQQMILELGQAHEKTRALLRDLEAAQQGKRELYPTWTIKELLAHLTGWDDACIATLRAVSSGSAPATPAARGIDPYNTSTVLEREALSLEQVIQEWEVTRADFLLALRELPEEKLGGVFVYPWGPKGDLPEMVKIFVEHEQEHAQEVRQKILGG